MRSSRLRTTQSTRKPLNYSLIWRSKTIIRSKLLPMRKLRCQSPSEALDAMAVLASIDWFNDKADSEWMARILKINPVYGEAYSTGAHFMVINRRYEPAIGLYRKALELNPRLWEARSELGMNLMRTGHNEEASKQLKQSYEAGYRNAETVNSLALLDSLKDFQSLPYAHYGAGPE